MFYKRTIEKKLKQLEKTFPVILLTGPRQVGKSSLLKEYGKGRMDYISFDSLDLRRRAKNDPKLFLDDYSLPLIIDEIQYVPELLSYIKLIVDEDRKNGMFFLTGSQKFHLMKGVSESLAGRIAIIDILGFSNKEMINQPEQSKPFLPVKKYADFKDLKINEVYQNIWRGSFPELYKNKELIWEDFYLFYIQTYIERDIRDLTQVADENIFFKFLQTVAGRTGQLLNYTNISKEVGVSQPTIKQWISLLETSGIIYLLRPYSNNLNSRIVKTPKLYFLDTGLCAYLSGWSTADVLKKGAVAGAYFETYVISEIIKSYWHNGKSVRNLYFYRDSDMREIDLIFEKDGILYPIEIKKKSNPDKNDIKSFSALNELEREIGEGVVLCLCKKSYSINNKTTAVNIGVI